MIESSSMQAARLALHMTLRRTRSGDEDPEIHLFTPRPADGDALDQEMLGPLL